MIKLRHFTTLMCLSVFVGCASDAKLNMAPLESTYLGQTPPGEEPVAFAPGLVTTSGYEYGGVFTPDMNAFYYIRKNSANNQQEVMVVRKAAGDWQQAVFSERKGTHLFSPDGNTMHLGGRFKERMATGEWSEIKKLAAPLGDLPIMRLSSASNGTVYFDEFKRDFTGDIRYSRNINGHYEEPQLVGATINSGRSFHPFIAPDESYLIFDSKRDDGFGDSDLYISYRNKDGTWGEAINLGDKINTPAWEAAANVTADGKYMFFNRNIGSKNYENVDIYWVDAQFIEELRPK